MPTSTMASASSLTSTGPAGPHFERQVGASYLLAMCWWVPSPAAYLAQRSTASSYNGQPRVGTSTTSLCMRTTRIAQVTRHRAGSRARLIAVAAGRADRVDECFFAPQFAAQLWISKIRQPAPARRARASELQGIVLPTSTPAAWPTPSASSCPTSHPALGPPCLPTPEAWTSTRQKLPGHSRCRRSGGGRRSDGQAVRLCRC